ncbi:MAG: hypothetical protein KBG80_02620 [Breznakibacter sp.]|nr:hypothetical protein [Breznakibacter sp.]
MRKILLMSVTLLMMLGSISCNAQESKKAVESTVSNTKVEIYYFHFTRRCNTCQSVEENAKLAVEQLYADKVKTGEYTFKGLNLDDESTKAIAEKLGVGGQSLLVVCGNNKVDITDKGFMNAHNLDKMEITIKTAVEKALTL